MRVSEVRSQVEIERNAHALGWCFGEDCAELERGDIPWELGNAEDADCLVATHRHPQGANYICSQP